MSGTIFNIFGDHLTSSVHKQVLRVNDVAKENSGVGKGALLSQTPARKPLGCCTPQASNIKKTFLQNRGALSVGKQPKQDGKVNVFKSINKNNLQIYEDNSSVGPAKPKVSDDDVIQIEYNRRPYADDDGYLSDSDIAVTEETIDNMIFEIPEADTIRPPEYKAEMLNISNDSTDLNDEYPDDELNYLTLDVLELPEI